MEDQLIHQALSGSRDHEMSPDCWCGPTVEIVVGPDNMKLVHENCDFEWPHPEHPCGRKVN